MAKITAPNKQYNGTSASVPFCNGVGVTTDEHLIEWFKNHNYEVEEPEPEVPEQKPEVPEQKPSTKKGK